MRYRFLIFSIVTFCLAVLMQTESHLRNETVTDSVQKSYSFDNQGKISASDVAEFNLPRQNSSISRVPRTASQARRTTPSVTSGFASIKPGKQMNHHSEIIFLNSVQLFASGLAETTHHLISLGKLII